MAMVYTIVSAVQEKLLTIVDDMVLKQKLEKERLEREKEELERVSEIYILFEPN